MPSPHGFNLQSIADSSIFRRRRDLASRADLEPVATGDIDDAEFFKTFEISQDTSVGTTCRCDDDLMNLDALEKLIQTYYNEGPEESGIVTTRNSGSSGRCNHRVNTSTSMYIYQDLNDPAKHTQQALAFEEAGATGKTRLTLSVNGTSTVYTSSPTWRCRSPREHVTVQTAHETLEGQVRSAVVQRMQEALARETYGIGF